MVLTINFVLEAGQDKMDGRLPKEISQLQGFILAGGQSRRMGTDKSQLKLENQTFTERIYTTLVGITGSVKVVRAEHDVYPNWGALGGLHAALAACTSEWAVIVACDLPFVSAELFKHLASLRTDHDAIVPLQSDGRAQPLAALYRVAACLPQTNELIQTGHRRPLDLLERVNTRWVPFSDLTNLTQAERFFVNINTPDDYDALTMRDRD
jgi:molybdopterin-guanine dinucleotide biosynthesis protein A